MKRLWVAVICLALVVCVLSASSSAEEKMLMMATTTSTDNTGLLDYLAPKFKEATGIELKWTATGTGKALKLGQNCDVDILMVHAPPAEKKFVADGFGTDRREIMYNDFVIVAPEAAPTCIAGLTTAAEGFNKLAEAQVQFGSRCYDSGTHTKEKAIWSETGIDPTGDWYISAGQGMGAVLTMADEEQAYTLSDRATFLARTLEGIDLVFLAGDKKSLAAVGRGHGPEAFFSQVGLDQFS